ncbi:3-phosphoshikimate 1-carboxyvinyltransferase 2 [Capsicum baccatum]|uniref:3-phosphoshikimate 1-carboxyvinyltransferase 2 n=1 Tax=Capsicum baccatum TaxID=33114 RepID=A0A2G2XPF2_CAPBA|nr:3-phosphoshikimate 1-carboxyvinyltransferase 2 [Capsicum baccatum]
MSSIDEDTLLNLQLLTRSVYAQSGNQSIRSYDMRHHSAKKEYASVHRMYCSLPSNVKKLYLLIRAPDANSTKHSFNNEMRDRPIGDLIDGLKQLSAEVDCFLGKKCPAVQIESEGGLPGQLDISSILLQNQITCQLVRYPFPSSSGVLMALQLELVPSILRDGLIRNETCNSNQVRLLKKGVFINPTVAEPFGLTLIETAAHGLPMVATKNGGPVDIHGVKRPAFHGLVIVSPPPVHH